VLQHIAFIGVYDTRLLNPPIWSLIYEMRISLVFPLLWLATRRLRSGGSLLLALALSLVSAILLRGDPGLARISLALTLRYSGFFVIGILLARHHRKMLPRPGTQTIALTCIAAPIFYYGALFTEKLAGPHLSGANQLLIAEWVTLFGAIGIVLAGLSARRLLHGGFPLFAGRISYSLYLVHFPVLLAVTSIAGTLSAWLQFPIYVFSTLAIATVFCLFIEEPCMRWGRSITTRKAPPPGGALERETGIEPATFSLGS
jgi:peptidoglycan/LPS O-acetylase OafA/YrhL